ncbi:MAG: ABC-F family ATP-binding cassette domain-containing protein [Firmicutes bacterium]|nr:ABC-F family ATP-binding cassette domain-containing protein [Bacillota bacterium]
MSKPLIQVTDLAKEYGFHQIFRQISLLIREGETVAIVGPNGVGKSTLLKILAGQEQPTAGTITWFRDTVSVAYVPQDHHFADNLSVEQVLAAEEERLQAAPGSSAEAISRFGFSKREAKLRVTALSGGQKTRLALATAWLARPELLLLDEPTNNLDHSGLAWLTTFVKEYPGTVVLVSHDRHFLDEVADRIIELSATQAVEYQGGYTNYREAKAAAFAQQTARYEQEQKRIRKIEESIAQQMAWFAKSHRAAGQHDYWRARSKRLAKQAKARIKRLEALKESGVEKPRPEAKVYLPGFADAAGGHVIIQADQLTHSFAQPLFQPVSFTIFRGEKIGIVGDNGCGKTTLLNLVLGRLQPTGGRLWVSPGARIGYLDQELQDLNPEETVLEAILNVFDRRTPEVITRARTLLASFLFAADDLGKRIAVLSTGERKRLAMVKLLVSQHNLLVFDEPTNHLDLPTREALEEALLAFGGTVLIVSHDRYLLQRVCTRILLFRNRQIVEADSSLFGAGRNETAADERLLLEVRLAKLDAELTQLDKEDPRYAEVEKEYFAVARKLQTHAKRT